MKLKGKRIVVLVADAFEDLEYWVTVMRLREEGAEVISVGPGEGPFNGKNSLEARADATANDVSAGELDGIVIPGGWAPDKLRRYKEVTDLVRAVHERGKVVGIICHGGLVAISAGIVDGVSATGSLGIKDDLVNAGAMWVDKTWFGGASSPTSRLSAANSSPPRPRVERSEVKPATGSPVPGW